MLLESVFVGNQAINGLFEGIQYSPPKDAMDSTTFTNYFVGGSFALPERQQSMELEREPTQVQGTLIDELSNSGHQYESETTSDPNDAEKYSVAGSLNTCAPTDTRSTSPKSTYTMKDSVKRGFRTEKKHSLMTVELSNDDGLRNRAHSQYSQRDEKEVFLNSLLCTEISNQRVTKMALKMIDRLGFITEEEWQEMTTVDQVVLKSYVENIYGFNLTPNDSQELLVQLNNIIAVEPKGKRNEEKLKKTVKKVNSMITKAFVNINNLHHFDENQLSEILYSAYFGHLQKTEDSLINIFANSLAFSQKAFSKIVENQRYAEDFETILKSSYVPDFIKGRQDKVLKSISLIRRKIEFNTEADSGSLNDLIKRTPWQLSEIVDGAKLCQSIIEKSKLL